MTFKKNSKEILTGAMLVEKNNEIPTTWGTQGGRIEYGEIGWSAVFTTEVHEWSHADDGDFVLREPLLSLNVTIIAIIVVFLWQNLYHPSQTF